jgi:hypothetical protein
MQKRDMPDEGLDDELIARELEEQMFLLGLIVDGLAVRRAGLIYRLPLCHDFGNLHS